MSDADDYIDRLIDTFDNIKCMNGNVVVKDERDSWILTIPHEVVPEIIDRLKRCRNDKTKTVLIIR